MADFIILIISLKFIPKIPMHLVRYRQFSSYTSPCRFLNPTKCTQTAQNRRKFSSYMIFSESAINLPPPLEEFSSTDPFPIVHFYYLENQENEEIKLVLKAFWCPIFMKLSGKLLYDVLFDLRPSPGASGTSISTKTPGRDLEDRWSLDKLLEVQNSWNFQGSLSRIFFLILDHHQVRQEPPRPPRL